MAMVLERRGAAAAAAMTLGGMVMHSMLIIGDEFDAAVFHHFPDLAPIATIMFVGAPFAQPAALSDVVVHALMHEQAVCFGVCAPSPISAWVLLSAFSFAPTFDAENVEGVGEFRFPQAMLEWTQFSLAAYWFFRGFVEKVFGAHVLKEAPVHKGTLILVCAVSSFAASVPKLAFGGTQFASGSVFTKPRTNISEVHTFLVLGVADGVPTFAPF